MRRVAAVLTGTVVAAGASFLVASPAQAATLAGPTYNPATQTITASASRGGFEDIRITLSGPGGPDVVATRSGLGESASVTVRRTGVTYNGTYRVVVTSSQAGGGRTGQVTVTDPPATPKVQSAPGGVGVATISWNDNVEPDFIGYAVVENGATVRTLSGACGGPCSTTLTDLAPGDHSFSVVATRSNGTGGQVSAASAPTSVTVAAPAPPPTTEPPATDPSTPTDPGTPPDPGVPTDPGVPGQPTTPADPGTGGVPNGPGATPGVTGTPTATPSAGGPSDTASPRPTLVTTPRRGTATFGGFSGFGTALSVPGLRLGVAPPSLAGGEAKVPDGTYDPELAYDSEIRETSVAGSDSGGNALGPIGDAIDSEQLMRTLAAALILLLAGAHLRRWLSASDSPTL